MKWFKNMKIGLKILLGFLFAAFIAGITGIYCISNINKINDLDTKLYNKMTQPLGDVIEVSNDFNNIRANTRDILLSDNTGEIQDYISQIKDNSDKFDYSLNKLSETTLTIEAKKAIEDIKVSKSEYMNLISKITQLKNQNRNQEAINNLYSEGKPILEKLQSNLKTYTDLKLKIAKETSDGNSKTADNTTLLTAIILIIGVILSILTGVFISLSISRPVNKIIRIADKIADGDFNISVNIDSKDEIGLLALSFRRMAEKLNNTICNINSATEQVSAGAKQVSDSSVALSEGAMEQASSIEELTASIEEISAQTKMNAENSTNANEIAVSAKINAQEGYEQMKAMKIAVEDINNASTSIYKIIKVIDEIAFQTNILALNAAVEAARAGQHGKGFAVVAEEVRNLAARSAKAAKETAEMIEGAIRKAEMGTKIAKQTSEALNKIGEDTVKVAEFINQIAVASNEQAEGISQINQGVIQISAVVQTNSATAEESASASEELASQAEMLKDQVSKFKLRETKSCLVNNSIKNIDFDMM